MEQLGGMTKAVDDGLPKRLIEEAATKRQAAVDRGEEIIVGVNKFRLENEEPLDILDIDNSAVRALQIKRLESVRRQRNPKDVEKTLATLSDVARTGQGNLLESAVEAARARATVGEIRRHARNLRRSFSSSGSRPRCVRRRL